MPDHQTDIPDTEMPVSCTDWESVLAEAEADCAAGRTVPVEAALRGLRERFISAEVPAPQT